jgi:ATP-dependent Clp endopeptidase proteolytic subunit ClpP
MAYEIDILGEIGNSWGYPANYLRYQLKDAEGQPVALNISSPGGEVTEGLAMVDMLEAYPGEVTTLGFGLVASIASVVLLAGKRVKMTPNSFLMIHNPWTMAVGDSTELTATADLLAKMEEKLLNIYVSKLQKSGKSDGNLSLKVKRMMDAETWFTAQEALDMGFIDEIQEATKEANIIQMQPALARYLNVPAALFNNQKPEDMTAQEVLKKVKAMLGGADETETVEATTTEPVTTAPEMTADQAKELLEKSGFKVMTAEEIAALTAKSAEVEETNVQLAETMQALATEMQAVKAQVKQQMAAPSGASNRSDSKPEETPASANFKGWAKMFTQKLTR